MLSRELPFPQDAQQTFWSSVAGMPSSATVQAAENIIHTETTEETYAEGGEYLPLGVWRTRGFDDTLIETKSQDCDIRVCPVLGKCYRVRICSKSVQHNRALRRESKRSKARRATGGHRNIKRFSV